MSYQFQPPSYRARCTRVVDGDTIDVVVDVGFRISMTMRLRLVGVNTPEMNAKDPEERAGAKAAKDWLDGILPKDNTDGAWSLRIVTRKDPDSFGRWLAEVFIKGTLGENEASINAEALNLGHAKPFMGGK